MSKINNPISVTKGEISIISSKKLLDNIISIYENLDKKNIQDEDENLSKIKHYLYLMKLSNNCHQIGVKLKSLYYESEIALLERNVKVSLSIGIRILYWINKYDLLKFNTDVILSICKILANSAEVCKEEYILYSCMFLFKLKNIFMKQSIKNNNDINEYLKIKFPLVIKDLTKKFNEVKAFVFNNREDIINLGKEVKEFLNRKDSENNNLSSTENQSNVSSDEFYYIIDKRWISNFLLFVEKLEEISNAIQSIESNEINNNNKDNKETKDPNILNQLFNTNKICLKYFEESISNDNKGIFCGPVNNFELVRPKISLEDKEDKYTNVFIKNNIENLVYFIPSSIYQKIEKYFICSFDIDKYESFIIKRRLISTKDNKEINNKLNNKLIEDLLNIKVLLLNEDLRQKGKEYITIKTIQINQNDTLQDLHKKISRIFNTFLIQNDIEVSDYDFKIYECDYDKLFVAHIILNYLNCTNSLTINKGKFCENMEADNKTKISEYFNINKIKNSFLCIEVIDNNSIVTPFIKFVDLNKQNNLYCSYCDKIINNDNNNNASATPNEQSIKNDEIVKCNFCNFNIYCSKQCRDNDSQHLDYHLRYSFIFDKELKKEDIDTMELKTIINKADKNNIDNDNNQNDDNINSINNGNNNKIIVKKANGLSYLTNPGGMDFFNSVIHTLSFCETLTKYFLAQSHLYLDSKGNALDKTNFVSLYCEILYKIWINKSKEVNPAVLRDLFFNEIVKMTNQKLDILDIFLMFIEKMNKDLNRNISDSINGECSLEELYAQTPHETDLEASKRFVDNYKKMNDSIVNDCFEGQLQIKIICQHCKNISTTYPNFYCLNLHLFNNNKDNYQKTKFKVFPYANIQFYYMEIIYFDVNKSTKIKDIKKKINEYKALADKSYESLLYKDNDFIEILNDDSLIYNYVYPTYEFSDDEFIDYEIVFIENISKNKEKLLALHDSNKKDSTDNKNNDDSTNNDLPKDKNNDLNTTKNEIINENDKLLDGKKVADLNAKPNLEEIQSNTVNIYITPITFTPEVGYIYTTQKAEAITYTRIFTMNINNSIYDLQREIFKYYRRAMDDKFIVKEDVENDEKEVDESYYIEFYQRINDKKYIDDEFASFILEKGMFDLYFYHNLPKTNGYVFTGPKCEFCGYSSDYRQYCKCNFFEQTKLKEIVSQISIKRDIFLLVDFKKYEYMFNNFYICCVDYNDPKMNFMNIYRDNLYDSFEILSLEKKAGANEKNYFCPKCGVNNAPNKIINLFRSPKYLFICLERYKKKFDDLIEMINNVVDDTLVGYPLKNLDLSSYFLGEIEDIKQDKTDKNDKNNKNIKLNIKKKDIFYNLKVVLLRIGTVKKAKFVVIVKCEDDCWYEIDDNNINKIDEENVVSKDAYILIYEKQENLNVKKDNVNNENNKEINNENNKEIDNENNKEINNENNNENNKEIDNENNNEINNEIINENNNEIINENINNNIDNENYISTSIQPNSINNNIDNDNENNNIIQHEEKKVNENESKILNTSNDNNNITTIDTSTTISTEKRNNIYDENNTGKLVRLGEMDGI